MAYIKIEEANVTTLDQARPDDADAVLLTVAGEEVLTLAAMITTEEARPVGKMFEDTQGAMWWALTDETIRNFGPFRSAQMTDSALRVCGWDL